MMQMEVDFPSPSSFTAMRKFSSKRARSPDESSSSDRPTKKLSVAIDEALQSSISYRTSYSHLSQNGSNSSRHPSEDWVQQTGVLSIDSPLIMSASPSLSDSAGGLEEEVMQMDSDENASEISGRPHLSLRTSFHETSLPQSNIPPSPQQMAHLQGEGAYNSSPYLMPPNAMPQPQSQYLPSINVLPPTPDMPRQTVDYIPTTRPSTPISDNLGAMDISPTRSFATADSPSSPSLNRRQRFTMGPRTDCEKCRLGVKGHWMHF